MPTSRTRRRRSRAIQAAIANATSVRTGRNHASALRIWKPSWAASSSSELEDLDPPDVRRKVVRDLLAKADPVGGLEHDRLEVERDDAARRRDGAFVALEYRDEGAVRLLDAQLPQPLQLRVARAHDRRGDRRPRASRRRPAPRAAGSRRAAASAARPRRRPTRTARRRPASRRPGGSRRPRSAPCSCIGEDRSVERDAVDPDRERGQEQEQAREHEHDEDRDRAPTRPAAR